jgi:hypothetical protein
VSARPINIVVVRLVSRIDYDFQEFLIVGDAAHILRWAPSFRRRAKAELSPHRKAVTIFSSTTSCSQSSPRNLQLVNGPRRLSGWLERLIPGYSASAGFLALLGFDFASAFRFLAHRSRIRSAAAAL